MRLISSRFVDLQLIMVSIMTRVCYLNISVRICPDRDMTLTRPITTSSGGRGARTGTACSCITWPRRARTCDAGKFRGFGLPSATDLRLWLRILCSSPMIRGWNSATKSWWYDARFNDLRIWKLVILPRRCLIFLAKGSKEEAERLFKKEEDI